MKKLLILTACLLSACTILKPPEPPKHEVQVVVKPKVTPPPVVAPPKAEVVEVPSLPDTRCNSVAKYARALANLRDINVDVDDIAGTEAKASKFPMSALRVDIYSRPKLSPEETYNHYQQVCVEQGYDTLIKILVAEESTRQKIVDSQQAKDPKKLAQKKATQRRTLDPIVPKTTKRDDKIIQK